jgi:hypothetical protein
LGKVKNVQFFHLFNGGDDGGDGRANARFSLYIWAHGSVHRLFQAQWWHEIGRILEVFGEERLSFPAGLHRLLRAW